MFSISEAGLSSLAEGRSSLGLSAPVCLSAGGRLTVWPSALLARAIVVVTGGGGGSGGGGGIPAREGATVSTDASALCAAPHSDPDDSELGLSLGGESPEPESEEPDVGDWYES